MRIYYQVGEHKALRPESGDQITELNLMRALARFATVDYSNQRFDPALPDGGLSRRSGRLYPCRDYDLYYVRNNPALLLALPEPKIYLALPYHAKAFGVATALATYTEGWAAKLRESHQSLECYPAGYSQQNVITLPQVVGSAFRPLRETDRAKEIRARYGGDFLIGHFGRVDSTAYPLSFLNVLPELRRRHPGLRVVFAGGTVSHPDVISDRFDYTDMPYVISTCDLLLDARRVSEGHFAGSMKILEAMACGVPIVCPRFDACVEKLGEDYELYHEFTPNSGRYPERIEREIFEKINAAIENRSLRSTIGERLVERARFYNADESATRLENTLRPLVEEHAKVASSPRARQRKYFYVATEAPLRWARKARVAGRLWLTAGDRAATPGHAGVPGGKNHTKSSAAGARGVTIFLFTSSFPYGKAEPFLEAEVECLADAFARVCIVPAWIPAGGVARFVPSNVEVLAPMLPSGGFRKSIFPTLLRCLVSPPLLCRFLRLFVEDRAYRSLAKPWRFTVRSLSACYALKRRGLSRILAEAKCDPEAAILYFYWSHLAFWLAASDASCDHIPSLSRFHGADLYEERSCNGGYIPFRRALLRKLSWAIFISEHGSAYLKSKYGDVEVLSWVSRLGTRDGGISAPSTDGVLRLVSCSFLEPVKRLDRLIDALSLVESRVHWTHLGDGSLRAELAQQARARLPGHVTCDFPGHLPNDRVLLYYRDNPCDLFVNVSESEGVPVSVMEALSFGIPVLATDVGGTREIVDDSVGGLLPADIRAEALAARLDAYARQGDGPMEKLRESARERWSERCSAAKNYGEFVRFLGTL